MKKNILFISEMPPVNTYASSAVFYRHLMFLEAKGFNIHVIIDENSYNKRKKDIPSSWKVFVLPNRKWFFPPYKASGLLQHIRFAIYYHLYVKKILLSNKIDLMIGFLFGEFLSPFCAFIKSRNSKLPYVSFFHDDPAELNFNKNKERIIENTCNALVNSNKVFIASKGFYKSWASFKDKFQLLPPVPESFDTVVGNRTPNPDAIVFGYSGSIYNELIPYFEQLAEILSDYGHKLILIGGNTKAKELAEKFTDTVEYLPLFPTVDEANSYLLMNCDSYIIPYPEKVEEMPWIKTCFPSKFIQIAQLGLPTLIIAPRDSALGEWCAEKKWELYTDTYEKDKIISMISKIFSSDSRSQMVDLRNSDFSPHVIQNEFYKTIKELLNESV